MPQIVSESMALRPAPLAAYEMIVVPVILSAAKKLRCETLRFTQGDRRKAVKLGGTAKLFAPMAESFFFWLGVGAKHPSRVLRQPRSHIRGANAHDHRGAGECSAPTFLFQTDGGDT